MIATENLDIYSVKGITIYSPVMYPEIDVNDMDDYTISIDGDRIDNLSQYFYGTTDNWWIIAIANNLPKHTMFIEPGIQLRIPRDVDKIQTDFELLNVNI
jgi:hypothetical protein